jgi:hypothetical protein
MRRLILLLIISLAVLSCAPPPFNLELSLSARTARGLTTEGTVGPIDKSVTGAGVVDAEFFPETGTPSGLDLQNGFLLSTYSWGDRNLAFISWNAGKAMYTQAGTALGFGTATVDPFPGFQIINLKGAPHSVGVFAFSSSDPTVNQFDYAQADPSTGAFPVAVNTPTSLGGSTGMPTLVFGTTGSVIGVSRYPTADPSQDITYWLFKALGADNFREGNAPVTATGIVSLAGLSTRPNAPYSLGATAPTGLLRALYYYDPEPSRAPERSYLSWYDQGKARWRCWWWSGMTPQAAELAGVDHRVDAVLTTGELFSAEGDTGRVFASDGTVRVMFPLPGMHFVEERFVNGTPRVLFSQYLFYNNSGWVNIYSIATKDLDSLKAW